MRQPSSITVRLNAIYTMVLLVALAACGRILYLQLFTNLDDSSLNISFKTEDIEATRGSILAHDGRLLASSVPFYQIRMDMLVAGDSLFKSGIDSLSILLSKFYQNKSAKAYKEELIDARKKGNRYKMIGNRVVNYTELTQIQKFPIFREGPNRGGVISEQKNKRNNPFGKLGYRTIGFINDLGVGVGIEGSYDYYLRGIPGKQTVRRLLGGEWMPVDQESAVPPKDGYDVQTTLDVDIQEAAEDALREQLSLSNVFEGATAIVMEVETGAIRAIANMKKGDNGEFEESFNYAIGQATEPGSTFKLITLVALLEDGFVTLDTPIDAGNGKWAYSTKTFEDVTAGGYGLINVKKAFEKSSNVAFAKLAVQFYGNNEKQFVDRIHGMKINERLNVDLLGEARAVIHYPGDISWSKLTLPMMAMGYASLLTPMHTLVFYNAIANDGKMMRPYFVENLQKNGEIVKQFPPKEISGSICSKSTVKNARIALRGVVEHGTATKLNSNLYNISGKTGTAQIAFNGVYKDASGFRKHQASFAGFFPSENPKYSAIVVLYTNKTRENFYGGSWAAPVFKQIADKIYANSPEWNISINQNSKKSLSKPFITAGQSASTKEVMNSTGSTAPFHIPDSEWFITYKDSLKQTIAKPYETGVGVPNVINMGLRDAIYILENMGYSVKFSGSGHVIRQSPEPGSIVDANSVINIELGKEGVI